MWCLLDLTPFSVSLGCSGFCLLGVWISSNLPVSEPRHTRDITRDIRAATWDRWVFLWSAFLDNRHFFSFWFYTKWSAPLLGKCGAGVFCINECTFHSGHAQGVLWVGLIQVPGMWGPSLEVDLRRASPSSPRLWTWRPSCCLLVLSREAIREHIPAEDTSVTAVQQVEQASVLPLVSKVSALETTVTVLFQGYPFLWATPSFEAGLLSHLLIC